MQILSVKWTYSVFCICWCCLKHELWMSGSFLKFLETFHFYFTALLRLLTTCCLHFSSCFVKRQGFVHVLENTVRGCAEGNHTDPWCTGLLFTIYTSFSPASNAALFSSSASHLCQNCFFLFHLKICSSLRLLSPVYTSAAKLHVLHFIVHDQSLSLLGMC